MLIQTTPKCVNIRAGMPSRARLKIIFSHISDKHTHFLQFINLIIFHTFPVFWVKFPDFSSSNKIP